MEKYYRNVGKRLALGATSALSFASAISYYVFVTPKIIEGAVKFNNSRIGAGESILEGISNGLVMLTLIAMASLPPILPIAAGYLTGRAALRNREGPKASNENSDSGYDF